MTTNRPDATLFARGSYYLALATSGIILLVLILTVLRQSGLGGLLVWLAIMTSAVGTFMAWTARKEFKVTPPPDDIQGMANLGWRINRLSLILLGVLMLFQLVILQVISRLLPAIVK